MQLVGKIGSDGCIKSGDVHREIAQAKAGGARAILVTLNSAVGGDVNEAFDVAAALRLFSNTHGRVIAHVPQGGRCVSAATIPLFAADYIVADPSAALMIHRPSGGEDGSSRGSVSLATSRLVSLYEEYTTLGSRDTIRGLLEGCGNRWLTGWDTINRGFADELGGADRAIAVARALAWSWPCWPANVSSPRRSALLARAALAKAQQAS